MASLNPTRGGNTTATTFTGLTRPISIMADTPGSVTYQIPGNSAYRSRKTVEVIPEGRTGPYVGGQKMRIILPVGADAGFADIQGTGRLHFDLNVQSDSTFNKAPTFARTKVSGQSLLNRVMLYQQSNNNLEDFRYYNRFQNYIGKMAATPPAVIHSETGVFEYDITEVVAASLQAVTDPLSSTAVSIQVLGGADQAAANNWASSETVHMALPINIGFFTEPILIPLEFFASSLIIEITWEYYQVAFLDTALSAAQIQASGNEVPGAAGSQFQGSDTRLITMIPNNITSSPALAPATSLATAAQGAQNPYTNVCNGTYQVTNVTFRYTEVDVDETLKTRVYARIKSADGLYFHYDSVLYDSKQWSGASVQLDYADLCKSLKSVYFLSYPQNADTDSWTMPFPELAGMTSLQLAVNTELWPKRPMTTPLEVFEEFNKALGVNNSRLNSRLIGRPEYFQGTDCTVKKMAFGISPYHNDRLNNFLPFLNPTASGTSKSNGPSALQYKEVGTTTSYQLSPPNGWDWGIGTLSSGAATINSTAVTITGATSPLSSAELGCVILVSIAGASSTPGALSNTGSLSVGTLTPGASFVVSSTNGSDTRQFYWLVMPRPALQTRTLAIAGLSTPAAFCLSNAPVGQRVVLFQNYATGSAGYNLVVNNPNNTITNAVTDFGAPGSTPAGIIMYAAMSETFSPGNGPLVYNVAIPVGSFTPVPGLNVLRAYLPIPPGVSLAATASVIVRPAGASTDGTVNNGIVGTNGDWQSLMEVYINPAPASTVEIRVPSWAINLSNRGSTSWNVAIADLSLFSSGGAATNTVSSYSLMLNVCQAQRGPYALQWGVTQYVPYGPVITTGPNAGLPLSPNNGALVGQPMGYWQKSFLAFGMLMEAESNPYTISGVNLNPNKHIYVYIIRSNASAGQYVFYDPLNNPSPSTTDVSPNTPVDIWWNGNNINNAGGFPIMTTDAYFLHDRGVTLQDGSFGLVTF